MKKRFDVAVVVPLDEEFETALSHFRFVADLSTPQRVRFEMAVPEVELSILLVKQNVMGRTECSIATMDIVDEFDVGMLVCLGIAGGLSSDVSIGDICRTGEIVDLLDNAKVTNATTKKGAKGQRSATGQQIAFSPTHYATPVELSVALDLDRLLPERRESYDVWIKSRGDYARSHLSGEFIGKDGKRESVGNPVVRHGSIACASVSDSSDYNKAIKKLDRKILAVETESGGLFSIADRHQIPALTIRGISDYAGQGIDKSKFEQQTKNKARLVAASNASSYLARQLTNPKLSQFLVCRRGPIPVLGASLALTVVDRLANAIVSQSAQFDDHLKDLAPGFSLQGYRIPVPRVRITNGKGDAFGVGPDAAIELREIVKLGRVTVVELPPQYPDRSLAYIAARDLLMLEIPDRQVVPSVVEARDLHRPNRGILVAADAQVIAFKDAPEALLTFVVNDFDFSSRTQTEFLLNEVNALPNAKFIVVSRSKSNVVAENEFVRSTGALVASLEDVSFVETAHFLQKNFQMSGPEAEVVAIRLHDTFSKFKLSAHPSYFAGIPASTLTAILRANRRAELIELAVAGYLSFVVADDDEPLALSRTTREKFLTQLAFEMNVNKRSFSPDQLVAFASEFAVRFDFKISSVRFVHAFVDKGILFFDGNRVLFTLTFMESFLLAKKLHGEPAEALKYFRLGEKRFDLRTFALYAELGISTELLDEIQSRLDAAIDCIPAAETPLLLTNDVQPLLLAKQDRVAAIQSRLQRAIEDVTNDRDASQEKQRLIDAAERIRKLASLRSQETVEVKEEEKRTAEQDAVEVWFVTILLLGSGAERLEAEIKRKLVGKIIRLSSLILDDWTRESVTVDYQRLKAELREDVDLLQSLAKSESESDLAEAKRTIDGLVDLLEYSFVTQPFRVIVQGLSEEARDMVLAESVINTKVSGLFENLLKALWLSDLDTPIGIKKLNAALKQLPGAKLLRMTLASFLITRVYWRHWDKASRLKLLNAAKETLKGAGLHYDKAGLQRLIEREEEKSE